MYTKYNLFTVAQFSYSFSYLYKYFTPYTEDTFFTGFHVNYSYSERYVWILMSFGFYVAAVAEILILLQLILPLDLKFFHDKRTIEAQSR